MNTKINIDCDDEKDLLIILSDIRANVRDAFKKSEGKDEVELSFENHNCNYDVKIKR